MPEAFVVEVVRQDGHDEHGPAEAVQADHHGGHPPEAGSLSAGETLDGRLVLVGCRSSDALLLVGLEAASATEAGTPNEPALLPRASHVDVQPEATGLVPRKGHDRCGTVPGSHRTSLG